MAGRLQPYSAAGLRAGGRSRRKSIEPVSTETSRQPRPCSSPPPPPRPGPPPRPRHSRPLIPCRSPESGVGRTPAYSIEIGGSRHYFRLIRRLSKDDTGALLIEDFDRNTVLVHRENSGQIARSAPLTELPMPDQFPALLVAALLLAGWLLVYWWTYRSRPSDCPAINDWAAANDLHVISIHHYWRQLVWMRRGLSLSPFARFYLVVADSPGGTSKRR